MTTHYKGKLGEFVYDSKEFEYIIDTPAYLFYVGEETNGSKIEIPKGINSCRYMFSGSRLTIPPVIPDGVTDCYAMFRGCNYLCKPPRIPNTVKDCEFMFARCYKLEYLPALSKQQIIYCEYFAHDTYKQQPILPLSAVIYYGLDHIQLEELFQRKMVLKHETL